MKDIERELLECHKLSGNFDETKFKGSMSIEGLLQKPFEKHIGKFEMPSSLKDLFDVEHINAIITWYLRWKLVEHIDRQNTCTIFEKFGYHDGMKVIIAINLYKYLRNKGYDPEVIEKIITK